MTIAKALIVIAVLIAGGAVLIMRDSKRKRVLIIEPTWQNAECIGDGGCNWNSTPTRSALIRHMPEPRGM